MHGGGGRTFAWRIAVSRKMVPFSWHVLSCYDKLELGLVAASNS